VTTTHLASSSDLPPWAVLLAGLLLLASSVILLFELRRRERGGVAIVTTGLLAVMTLFVAVLRPVRIASRESLLGGRVVVLADSSRSMALAEGGETRREVRDRVMAKLLDRAKEVRFTLLGFGDGISRPLDPSKKPTDGRSDLASALAAVADSPEERPQAVVVVSDGRLDDPPEGSSTEALKALDRALGVPIHVVATSRESPPDASVRRVAAAGAAVAHVPLPLRIQVGCVGLVCDELTVTAKELRDDGPPALLASGLAHLKGGIGTLDLTVTLDRAGPRILEIGIGAPPGDAIKENDRRLVTLDVARERIRVLHVAGEPTNDVRALRDWLKGDASIDVVAFFILRTQSDAPQADQRDLSLIPFPVDELFTEHLPSFDAVVLQDFDAQPYGLEKYLPNLAHYVRNGGGLIMVGGDNAFVKGGYANTPLGNETGVLPVHLDGTPGATPADLAPFTPSWTEAGRSVPLLAPLRAAVGEELPVMPGANVLGDPRRESLVLWQHPSRKAPSGVPMPVLAVAEEGNGRTIALGVDGGWQLEFSQLGARTGGRGHAALWDGLLGWLMRDPRFEPAQLSLPGGCVASTPSLLRAHLVPLGPGATPGTVSLDVTRIDQVSEPTAGLPLHLEGKRRAGESVEFVLPALESGGYTARLHTPGGPATRFDFACETGGDEWADSRPDPNRLKALAEATGGTFLFADEDVGRLPLPPPTRVSSERHVVPVAPPWAWTLLATVALGAHWITRRRSGLS
jgi:uncharacterized membrane protein